VTDAPIPTKLAQYEVQRRLGEGGMAEVFVAKKRGAEGTEKIVVVKRILPSFGASRRFQAMFIDEAQLATRLNHPNVVQVYDFSNEGAEGHILAMEYVEGPDFGMLITAARAKGVRLPPWVSAYVIAEAAKGLHYAHEKKDDGGASLEIVHRDVSPQNILLSYDGSVKIADFGIASARFLDEEKGVIKGKYGYMSPEQARGERVDRRSDLYALGVILWECLAGRPIHGSTSGNALLEVVRTGRVEPPSTFVMDVPKELEDIVMKLLAPRPDERFATGRELVAAIGRALLGRQDLVDAGALESTIQAFLPRIEQPAHRPVAERVARPAVEVTSAASPSARNPESDRAPGSSNGRASKKLGEHREVRHIALVTLELSPKGDPSAEERAALARALVKLRPTLDDMAYKRGARWQWSRDTQARAVLGLGSRHARAPVDSAWLALETHEAIAGITDDLPVPVAASMTIVRGIASGIRDRDGNLVRYTLHDPVTFLADALGSRTPPHTTWVAGGLYRLVRRDFRWGDAPSLEFSEETKVANLPPTMRIYTLERSLSREEKDSELGQPSDLVGRNAEKAELVAAYHASVNAPGGGKTGARAVIGELGIGKTALVQSFLNELPPNARAVRVESSPVRMEVPYSTIAELVRSAIGAKGDETFEEVVSLVAHAGGSSAKGDPSNPMVARLAELVTNRSSGHGDNDDAAYQKRLLVTSVRNLLGAFAIESPVVVVAESLHWADKPSLEVLTELFKIPDPLPILALLVSRPDERLGPLLEGKVRIELHGLSSDEQVRLVETRLGVKEGVRAVCAELSPRVGGNPFFLLELVDALLERGILEIRDDALLRAEEGEREFFLPQTLEQLLADRIEELPPRERLIVDWLAIAGGPLTVGDLERLFADGTSLPNPVTDPLARLCERGLCDKKGQDVDFRHPLTRDVAYAALKSDARTRMHKILGKHLAGTQLARGVSAAIVASHFARGDDGERASHFYLEAANAARTTYQTHLAVRYYKRALLQLTIDDPRRLTAHDALEGMFRMLGRKRDRVAQLEGIRACARQVASPRSVCIAFLRTARFDLDEGKLAHGLPIAKKAAQVARGASFLQLEIEAESLVSELSRELGDVQGALAAADRALAACDPNVNPNVSPRLRADALRSRGVLLRRVGRVREAMHDYVEAIAIYRRGGVHRQEARAKNALAYAMFVQGRYEDAIALALESIQIDLSVGGRFQLAKTLANIGQSYSRLGDMPRAAAYLKRARDAHERYGDKDGRADTLLVSAEVALDTGALEEAVRWHKEGLELCEATANAYDKAHALVVGAAISRALRDPQKAIAQAVEARRMAENQALVAYHFYAFAIEASARVDAGEVHSATLLATTALGAVETLQGTEYGLEIRTLCADALKRAGSPQAANTRQRAVDYATALMETIRDMRLRRCFSERPMVAALFDTTPSPLANPSPSPLADTGTSASDGARGFPGPTPPDERNA
jgi:serine/threonine protein kinase/tetratricopeptide (TPR) repeat protein